MSERLVAALDGQYKIIREAGAGGMATVYLAEDLKHDRNVALKVLRPELAATLGPARFFREIQVAARLQHPHILPLHDSGEAGGFLYYVMPFVDGESLRERLARVGELPIHDAVKILMEVVDALAYAHGQGVVHRDIKPDNVMLSGRHALVTDFGVAKAVSEATGKNALTTAGVALGTPSYMAPEQAAADPHLDHRVDIYAVGAMAYELVTGRPPFTGMTPQQVLAAHVTQTPEPVSKHRAAVTPQLEAVIMRCLAKRAADRWQSAEELLQNLEPLATPSGGMTPTNTRPLMALRAPGRGIKYWYAGAGIAALVAGGLWMVNRRPATAVLTSNMQLTRLPGVEEFPTISPDGKSVAYRVGNVADTLGHLETRRTDGGDAVQIPGDFRPSSWAPGGDRLLVWSVNGLASVPALGGQGRGIDRNGFDGCWSPDGTKVAYFVRDSLFVRSVDQGPPRFITTSSDAHSPTWSPDGKWIAFVSGNFAYLLAWNIAPSSVWVVSAEGGTAQQLTPSEGAATSPTWAPDSRRLLVVAMQGGVRDIYQVDLTAGGRPRGTPVRISTGLNPSLISLSADGRQLAYSIATHHSRIWKIAVPKTGRVSSKGAVPVTTDVETIEQFSISADGRWLAFDSDREVIQQLFRMPLAGGVVQQITHDSAPAFAPSLSPDGKEVAYHTVSQNLRRVFVISTEGGVPVAISPGTSVRESNPDWSHDGRRIAWLWVRPVADEFDIMIATRDTTGGWGALQTLTSPGRLLLGWADQGSAVFAIDSERRPVIVPLDGGPVRALTTASVTDWLDPNGTSVLSSDGRTIFLPGRTGGDRGIHALQLSSGRSREVVRFDEPSRPPSGFSEFGGWLYFILTDPQSDIWVASVTGLSR